METKASIFPSELLGTLSPFYRQWAQYSALSLASFNSCLLSVARRNLWNGLTLANGKGLNIFRKKTNSWQQLYLEARPVFLLPASRRVGPREIKVSLMPRSGSIPFISREKQGEGGRGRKRKKGAHGSLDRKVGKTPGN